jgi:hypothetical protein
MAILKSTSLEGFAMTASAVIINPLYPPILGDFLKLGGHPQAPGRKYPAPVFQRYHRAY